MPCHFSPPSLEQWTTPLLAYILFQLLGILPAALALYGIKKGTARTLAAWVFAIGLAGIGPVIQRCVPSLWPEPWVGGFLIASGGMNAFFKAHAVAISAYPEGADTSLAHWITWFTSAPEPVFAEGKPMKAAPGELRECLTNLIVFQVGGISVLCSLYSSSPSGAYMGGDGWVPYLFNTYCDSWMLYLFLALLLEVGKLLTLLGGHTAQKAFDAPLSAARSYRQGWGERWNIPMHVFLKRSVYRPLRKVGVGAAGAGLLTFAASGLVHEYQLSITNGTHHVWGGPSMWFVICAIFMMLEGPLWTYTPSVIQRAIDATPAPILCVVMSMPLLHLFATCFTAPWHAAGWLPAMSGMVPMYVCH